MTAGIRQLRLPGQAAAPDGPLDVSTMYFMHFAFRRDFVAFVAASRTRAVDRALTRGARRLRYRGVAKNDAWLKLRASGINLRQLCTTGLTCTPGGWQIAT